MSKSKCNHCGGDSIGTVCRRCRCDECGRVLTLCECGELFPPAESVKRNPSSYGEMTAGILHRPSDPETSHMGAQAVAPKLTELHREFYRRLAQLGEATAQEVSGGSESLRKRAKELERAGHIVATGRRRCKRTGHTATTYKVKNE